VLGLLPPLLISSEVFYKYTFPSLPSSSLLALDSSLVKTAELLLTPAPALLIKAAQ